MDPIVKPPVLYPALLAGRQREAAATFGVTTGTGKVGLRQRRLVRHMVVTLHLSPTNTFTTIWEANISMCGLVALLQMRDTLGFGLTVATGTSIQGGLMVNQTTWALRTVSNIISIGTAIFGTMYLAIRDTRMSAVN